MTQRTSIKQFPYIRVWACFAIVILHTVFASTVYFADTMTKTEQTVSQLVCDQLMWAVPCFLMVTGALLLSPQRQVPWEKLFKKYIKRIALALVAFTLIFQICDFIAGDQKTIVTGWLSNLLQGHSWAHMWYLYLMIGLYLMIPFYKMITEKATDKQLWGLVGIIIVFTSLVPIINMFGYECAFYIPTAVIYPAYLFIGHLLYRKNVSVPLAAAVTAGCTAAIVVLSLLRAKTDMDLSYMLDYASIFVVGQSAGVYSLMSNIKRTSGKLLNSVDQCSFGIYIIHMVGVRAVMKWAGIDPYDNILIFVGMIIANFICAYVITWCLRKVPKLNLL